MKLTTRGDRAELLLYGGSHAGKSLLWQSTDALVLYFWTEVVGVDRLAAGGLFLIGMVWSGLLDLLVGWLLAQGSGNRGRSFLLIGIPLSAFAFAAIFAAPWLWPQGGLVAAAITWIFFVTAYAVIDVPQNFLMFEIAGSNAQLARLAGARTAIGSAISIAVAAAVGWLVIPHQTAVTAIEHFFLAGSLAAMASVPLLFACVLPQRRTPLTNFAQPAARLVTTTTVFAHLVLVLVVLGVFSKSLPYAALEPGRPEHWAGHTFLLLTLGKVLGGLIWPTLANRFSVRRAAILAHLLTALFLFAAAWSDLPTVLAVEVLLLALGIALGGLNTLAWSMLADLTGPTSHQAAHPALMVGLFTITAKIAVGLGGGVAVWVATLPTSPLVLACSVASAAALLAVALLLRCGVNTGGRGV